MKVTQARLIQIIKEEITYEQAANMEKLLGDISRKLDGLSDLDTSIDTLTASVLGVDPESLHLSQGLSGRFATSGLAPKKEVSENRSTKKMRITQNRLKQIIEEEIKAKLNPSVKEAHMSVEDTIADSNRGRLFSHIERIPDGPQLGNVLEKLISYIPNEQVEEMLDIWFKDDMSEPESDVLPGTDF